MPRKKGRGEGKWRSVKTGRYVSSYYAKRNPNRAIKVESESSTEEELNAKADEENEE